MSLGPSLIGVSQNSVTNPNSISCIFIAGSNISGSVTNTSNGVIAGAFTGITISNSTIGSAIVNAGRISVGSSANGILITNSANVAGGISNSGAISAGLNGIIVGGTTRSGGTITISNFSGGISNSGTISSVSANAVIVGGKATGTGSSVSVLSFSGGITNSGIVRGVYGIVVGGLAEGSGASVTISNFSGGISNAGTISAVHGNGILVGGVASGAGASVTISTFAGGIANSGAISAGGSNRANNGIFVGGTGGSGASITIGTFTGGISNSGTISATGRRHGGNGIFVGGIGSFTGASITISTFAGGIINSGTISSANRNGILVGGTGSGFSVSISTFSGGVRNSGAISANGLGLFAGVGIWVGGGAVTGGSVTISTFSGGISNSGTIFARNVGIFAGGSTAGGAFTFSTFSGGITNSGTISASQGTGIRIEGISTFLGNVSNSGTIIAGSFGIFICDCATLAGGSIVNSGFITANTGIFGHSNTPVSITNSGIIVGSGGVAIDLTEATGGGNVVDILGGAISGNILGAGTASGDTVNFNLGSSGTFAYSNTIAAVQSVNIISGTLFDSGSIIAADVTVESGGTLAPGLPNTIGTLNITGNLTFNSGSAYEIMLAPPGSVSNTNVIGATVINGGTVEVKPLQFGHYNAGTYTILSASGGVTVNTPFAGPQFLAPFAYTGTATLIYPPSNQEVDLNLGAGYAILVAPGANQNQQNVVNGIDAGIVAGDTVPQQFQNLGNLSGQALLNALTQLDGEEATGAQTSAFQLMNEFLDLLFYQSSLGGGGGGGGLGFAPDGTAGLPPEIALAYDTILKAPPKPNFDQRWTSWGAAFGGSSITNGNAVVGSNNVTAGTYGFAGGMDYHVDPATTYGFALSGAGTNWNLAQGIGSGRSDAVLAALYAKHYAGPAYLFGALAFGNNWFTTNRTAMGDQLTASFAGQSYAARVEAGYRFALPVFAEGVIAGVTPYGAVQTQWFHTPAYSETDLTGGGLGLAFNSVTANDTRSELGARFDDLTTFYGMPLIWRGRLAWAHDWVSNPALDAAFQSLPGSSFIVNGASPPPDSALATAGAELHINAHWSALAKFEGDFAPSSQTYGGTGTLKYTW